MKRQLTVGDVKRANLPERYWKVSFNEIPNGLPYKERMRKYLDTLPEMLEKGVGLYLWSSENGTGKTSLAAVIVKESLRYGKTAFFTETGRLRAQLMNKEVFEDGVSIEARIEQVDVLVLDDIGKEYRASSGYTENAIETLVRNRVQKLRTTVLTGNIDPRDLQKIYSADFAALLKESTVAVCIAGHDFRSEKAHMLQTLL